MLPEKEKLTQTREMGFQLLSNLLTLILRYSSSTVFEWITSCVHAPTSYLEKSVLSDGGQIYNTDKLGVKCCPMTCTLLRALNTCYLAKYYEDIYI